MALIYALYTEYVKERKEKTKERKENKVNQLLFFVLFHTLICPHWAQNGSISSNQIQKDFKQNRCNCSLMSMNSYTTSASSPHKWYYIFNYTYMKLWKVHIYYWYMINCSEFCPLYTYIIKYLIMCKTKESCIYSWRKAHKKQSFKCHN